MREAGCQSVSRFTPFFTWNHQSSLVFSTHERSGHPLLSLTLPIHVEFKDKNNYFGHSMRQKSKPFPYSQTIICLSVPCDALFWVFLDQTFYVRWCRSHAEHKPERPGYAFTAGSSPFTHLVWEIRTVATLPSASPLDPRHDVKVLTVGFRSKHESARWWLWKLNDPPRPVAHYYYYYYVFRWEIKMQTRHKPVSKNQPITWKT